ncbi:MAG: hypothetical protein J5965_22995 [Aeriscardovia sp.]|nr:hypothetical protein [Aeriscardovia sp.]
MEKSSKKTLSQSTDLQPKAASKGVFTGSTGDIILKVICLVLGVSAFVVGILSGTWHNIMFAGMFYALYRAIRYEEDK